MRFLVLEDAQLDLVIGTESIVRHNLLSPLNLYQNTGVTVTRAGDKQVEELNSEKKQLKDQRDNLKRDRKRQQRKNPEYHDLDAEINELTRQIDMVDLRIDEYHAVRHLKTNPQDKGTKEYLDLVRAEINGGKAEAKKAKEDKEKAEKGREFRWEEDKENVVPQKASDISFQVEEPDGKFRTPTGFSATDGAGHVRHRK